MRTVYYAIAVLWCVVPVFRFFHGDTHISLGLYAIACVCAALGFANMAADVKTRR